MNFFHRLFTFFALVIVLGICNAQVGDLSAFKTCVEKDYTGISNHHSIVSAVIDANSFEIMTFGAVQENQQNIAFGCLK